MMENRARLLIIDDEPINIRMLDGMLRDDYDIIVALNGIEALKRAFVTLPPDLILLDIQMNGIDGYEVCQRLKDNEITREIPVIFVTSMTDEEDERKGLELGAVDYIHKPYRPSIIKARLRNHMELKRQRDQLSRLSSLDALTGIANRRSFEDFLEQEWRRAVRLSEVMSLIFMDIDHFKKYNDNYGHVAGDECLKEISNILKTSLKRPIDLLARYGGEEFVCVLPRTDIQGALHIAEKIHEAILAKAIPHAFSDTSDCVTLSFGVASLNPVREQNIPSDLIIAADNMLYKAKIQGRNRIMS
ncbi:MAG: diguanylate cyclase [Methylococcaceae bacterium]